LKVVRPYDHQKRCVSKLRDAFTQKGKQIIREAGNTRECYRFGLHW
jgi:hypothetical protein